MRLLVTGGTSGQLVRAMLDAPDDMFEVMALGRPDLDLSNPATLGAIIRREKPDVLVNAAAFTQVDKAEAAESLAMTMNGTAAGALAQATAELGIPIIQISTDYVFDGMKAEPYDEGDPTAPLSVYGRSKLAGERAVAAANPHHVILRTSWVYDGERRNFLLTMLRLAETRDEVRVVADQLGAPSYAPDIARCILAVARNLVTHARPEHYGLFHMTGAGETSWAGFAEEIFRLSAAAGGPAARVVKITTADYPTPARRPGNSRLNCDRLAAAHGVRMADWREALARCMALLPQNKKD